MPALRRLRGFTLIELMVAAALFALLIALAVPMYGNFLGNAQTRNAAEAVLNGVQEAQALAVKENLQTQLVVNPATGWQISFLNADTSIPAQTPIPPAPFLLQDGAPYAVLTATPGGATEISFDGFGRIIPNPDATATISCINVTNSKLGSARTMRVVVSNTTQGVATKLCDPQAAATEPQACPAIACG